MTDEQHFQDERTGGPDKVRKTVDKVECYVFGASFQHDQADRLDESIETAYRVCVGTANAAQRRNVQKYHLNRLLIHCFADHFPTSGKLYSKVYICLAAPFWGS
ncbi:MAG: hypothetical protein OSB46_12205 [Alphaproteobacteria bacterium]|nr:hypothetical protein [Alphaproteobacteria bacterium]